MIKPTPALVCAAMQEVLAQMCTRFGGDIATHEEALFVATALEFDDLDMRQITVRGQVRLPGPDASTMEEERTAVAHALRLGDADGDPEFNLDGPITHAGLIDTAKARLRQAVQESDPGAGCEFLRPIAHRWVNPENSRWVDRMSDQISFARAALRIAIPAIEIDQATAPASAPAVSSPGRRI